jgi:uncharacterized protein (DUF2252 family)
MSSFEDRQASLAQTRLRMAQSAHRYVRESTIKFHEWLDGASAKIPAGPAVWICGDCHIGNLGPSADAKGRVAIQMRDLDQTVIGKPVHDLIRLGLSLASAARGSDLPGVTTAKILEELISGYQSALAGDFDDPRDRFPGTIGQSAATGFFNLQRKGTSHVYRDNFAHHSRDRTSWRIQWDRRRALLWHRLLWWRRPWPHIGRAFDPGSNGPAIER